MNGHLSVGMEYLSRTIDIVNQEQVRAVSGRRNKSATEAGVLIGQVRWRTGQNGPVKNGSPDRDTGIPRRAGERTERSGANWEDFEAGSQLRHPSIRLHHKNSPQLNS